MVSSIIEFPYFLLQPFLNFLALRKRASRLRLSFLLLFMRPELLIRPIVEIIVLVMDGLELLHTHHILLLLDLPHYITNRLL